MIKVTALTGSKHDASSRFRIRQFIQPLRSLDVEVREYWPLVSRYKIEPLPWLATAMRARGLFASGFSDITWLGRELISGHFSFEHLAGKRRVFDVDDAIWLPYGSDFSAAIVTHCDGVIAGNRFLEDHYEKLGARVWLVPTSIDTQVWTPVNKEADDKWTIGWTGSWANLKFLYAIEEPLADFLAQYPNSKLLVVCDRRPAFKKLPDERWEFARWSIENEVGQVQRMDVGLMPLEDSEFSHGKCGFKMLSYMALELPVVVSPVGVNTEILAHDEVGLPAISANDWFLSLQQLHGDRASGNRMGRAGRQVVERHYSVRANVGKLAEIFHRVVESTRGAAVSRTKLPAPIDAKIAVIVPSYNHAAYIERCLKSIMNQTLRPSKLLVIDDGSQDNSVKIIERVLRDCPFPAELVVRQNVGLCATLNEGFAKTGGEYFAYLGSDDVWFPDFLANRVLLLDARPDAVLAFGHAYVIDEHDRIVENTADWEYYVDDDVRQVPVRITAPLSPTVLYRRAALERHRWNEASQLEDYELYLRLGADGDFAFDPTVLSAWRLHPHNKSRNATFMLNECLNALHRVAPQLGLSAHELARAESSIKWRFSENLIRHGSKLKALGLAGRSVRGAPSLGSVTKMIVRLLAPRRILQWRRSFSRERAAARYGSLQV